MFDSIKHYFISHQPYRFIGKSVKNIYFPKIVDKITPDVLSVELTSICNAGCVFCNYRLGFRSKKTMQMEQFEKILSSGYNMGYRRLDLTSFGGELFVFKKAIEAIELASKMGFSSIETYTNAILLHKFDLTHLLSSGITSIRISFPGFEKEIYKKIFGVDKFEEFSKSIKLLLEAHKDTNSDVLIVFEPRSPYSLRYLKKTEFFKKSVEQYISNKVQINKPIIRYDTWGGQIDENMLPKGIIAEINPLKSLGALGGGLNLCSLLLHFGVLANGDIRLCNCRYDSTIESKDDKLLIDNYK